ncbi:MAG: hypothetical protein ACKOTZ_05310 [Chloroflexota bacterium]
MTSRTPSPGPSFVRAEPLRLRPGDPAAPLVRPGLAAPSVMDDGWWLTHVWLEDDDGVLTAREIAPAAGPPPGPPLATLGPALAGALAGFIAEEDGRQLIRLRMPPAADGAHPWDRPLVLAVAIRWDAVRAATLRPNDLARELLRAFVRATGLPGAPA